MTGFEWQTFGVKKIFSILSGLLVMGKKVFCKQTADLVKKSFGPTCTHEYYNFTKFHQNQMKNKKVLLIACLVDVSSDKVLLRSR